MNLGSIDPASIFDGLPDQVGSANYSNLHQGITITEYPWTAEPSTTDDRESPEQWHAYIESQVNGPLHTSTGLSLPSSATGALAALASFAAAHQGAILAAAAAVTVIALATASSVPARSSRR